MKFKTCPLCDSPKIKRHKGPYDFIIKGEKVTTPAVRYWSCPNCGEVFLIAKRIKSSTKPYCHPSGARLSRD